MSLNPRRVVTFGIAKNGALDKRRITTLGLWPFSALIPPSYLKKMTILLIDKTRSIELLDDI